MIKRTKAVITLKVDGRDVVLEDDVVVMTFDDNQDEESRDEAMRFAAASLMRDKIKEIKSR